MYIHKKKMFLKMHGTMKIKQEDMILKPNKNFNCITLNKNK